MTSVFHKMGFALMKKILSFLVVMKVYQIEKLHFKFNAKQGKDIWQIYICEENQEKSATFSSGKLIVFQIKLTKKNNSTVWFLGNVLLTRMLFVR